MIKICKRIDWHVKLKFSLSVRSLWKATHCCSTVCDNPAKPDKWCPLTCILHKAVPQSSVPLILLQRLFPVVKPFIGLTRVIMKLLMALDLKRYVNICGDNYLSAGICQQGGRWAVLPHSAVVVETHTMNCQLLVTCLLFIAVAIQAKTVFQGHHKGKQILDPSSLIELL